MKAETRTLQGVLHGDRRFVVPVYQRPYVWEQEKQWEPLWNDIEATAIRLGEARATAFDKGAEAAMADQGAAPHFLGAIVIEDRPVMTGDVDTRLVVDGQQRLTTVQLLLRGVLDSLDELQTNPKSRARIRKAIVNDADVVHETQLLKISPRQAELAHFEGAMAQECPPPETSKFAAARSFFAEVARAFLEDDDIPSDPYTDGSPEEGRAALLVATLLGLVKLVVIDLEDADDAQIIFESLNARGTPLSATDLVKNLLFLRAETQHLDTGALYETHWRRFDDDSDWWMAQVGTGHAQRARQDWLLGDWLIAQLGRTISVGRLYGEFRRWLDDSGTKPFDALSTLAGFANAFEVLNGRKPGASRRELTAYSRIDTLNITVASPVLLSLFVAPPGLVSAAERETAVLAIESFVIRRMLAKDQTRAYGQVFVEVLKAMQKAARPALAVIETLRSAPHGYAWTSFDDIAESFATSRYYGPGGINQERLRLVLGAVDERLQTLAKKTESITIDYSGLQVEHVIPRGWRQYWPVVMDDPVAQQVAEQARERQVHRIGNLTLATGPLNSSLSNDPWEAKRAELRKHSKLQLNALLVEHDDWNDDRIADRSAWLAQQVDAIWPGPDSDRWSM
ncbi:MAG: DUF262 domain-containing protein [Acidimicrobiales bacterium]